jgi:hypothetical protein
MPLPCVLRWLCTSRESGASVSQNDALTGCRPALSPSSLHMTHLRSVKDHASVRGAVRAHPPGSTGRDCCRLCGSAGRQS